jgi:hypothetical protein
LAAKQLRFFAVALPSGLFYGDGGLPDNRIAGERRLLQCVIGVLAAVPVLAGLNGVLSGPALLAVKEPWPVDLDSHFRFLSGVFLAIGIAWYSCIPGIEANGGRFRLLAALTVTGGLARLVSLIAMGPPSAGHLYGVVTELLVVPLLVLWQMRVASRFRQASRPN